MQSSNPQNSNIIAQTTSGTAVSLINIGQHASNNQQQPFPRPIVSNKITTATQTSGATLGSILSAAAKQADSQQQQQQQQYSNTTTTLSSPSTNQTTTTTTISTIAKPKESPLIEALMSSSKSSSSTTTTTTTSQPKDSKITDKDSND